MPWGCTMPDLLAVAMLIIIAILFAWSSRRAWRAKNRFIKWGGTWLAALLSVVATLVSGIVLVGLFEMHARNAPVRDLKVAGTPERIERGRAISDGFCSACHSKTGTLTAGLDLAQDLSVPIGSSVSSNLPPIGQLNHWSDGDIFRAIRNSVDRDCRWLVFLSSPTPTTLTHDNIMTNVHTIPPL